MDQDSQAVNMSDYEREKGQITLEDLLTRTTKDEKSKKLLKTIQKLSKRQDELAGENSKSSSGASTPKNRGRPKGSKNRQKDEVEKPKPRPVKRASSFSDASGTSKKKIKDAFPSPPATKVVDLTLNDGANVKDGTEITSFKLTSGLSLEHSPWENNGRWYVGFRRILTNAKKGQAESMFINLGMIGLKNLEKATKLMMDFLTKEQSGEFTKSIKKERALSDDDDDEDSESSTDTDFSEA